MGGPQRVLVRSLACLDGAERPALGRAEGCKGGGGGCRGKREGEVPGQAVVTISVTSMTATRRYGKHAVAD